MERHPGSTWFGRTLDGHVPIDGGQPRQVSKPDRAFSVAPGPAFNEPGLRGRRPRALRSIARARVEGGALPLAEELPMLYAPPCAS